MRAPPLLCLCLAVVVLVLGGCKGGQPKSNARIFVGEAPTLRYSEQETAGGALRGTR